MSKVREAVGEESQSHLYDNVAEAITNVRQHAYNDGLPTPWWMFSTVTSDHILVAVHDRGRSIPATLMEKPGVLEQVSLWIYGRKKRDARILLAAIRGQSRTRLAYRGKGLPEMVDFTKIMADSHLSIYSRGGMFSFDSRSQVETSGQLKTKLDGTLLIWSLKIPDKGILL